MGRQIVVPFKGRAGCFLACFFVLCIYILLSSFPFTVKQGEPCRQHAEINVVPSENISPSAGTAKDHKYNIVAEDSLPMGYLKSSDLGITHCALQGIVPRAHYLLHLWIRAAVIQPEDGVESVLIVKGFAMSESLETSQHRLAQLSNAGPYQGLKFINFRASIGLSGDTNATNLEKVAPLLSVNQKPASVLGSPLLVSPADSHARAILRVSVHKPSRYPSDVLGLTGTFHGIPRIGKTLLEAQVHVEGIDYECVVWATVGSGEIGHPFQGGLGKQKQITFLVAPFYGNVIASEYARLLAWHVLWHQKFGVTQHVCYVTHQLPDLLADPRIQVLIKEKKLQLVLWQDLPINVKKVVSHLVIFYNHGLLSLQAADSLVLVADLDEYIMTPRQMDIEQIWSECVQGKSVGEGSLSSHPLIGPARLHRFDAYHADSASQGKPELALWVPEAGGVVNGTSEKEQSYSSTEDSLRLSAHPLLLYSFNPEGHNPKAWNQSPFKVILRPEHTLRVHVHQGDPFGKAMPAEDVDANCARWIHLVNLHRARERPPKVLQFGSEWLWPSS